MHFTKKIVKESLIIVVLILAFALLLNPVGALADDGSLSNFTHVNTYRSGQFSDVSRTAWYSSNVATAYELDLMKGSSSTYFNANGNVTLAETITVAARIHSIYYTGEENFPKTTPWYKGYVDYALAHGIITTNYPNLNQAATRSQFAVILSRALPAEALPVVNNVADGSIPDVSMNAGYANYVYTLYRAGILGGNDRFGTFLPNSYIKRCETAAIATRMADTDLRVSVTLGQEDITDAYAAEVVRLVNIERAKYGLNSLTSTTTLNNAATVRAEETQILFSHTRPDGTSCFTVLQDFGISYNRAGENIAIGQRTPSQVVQEWMDSPGHRANILSSAYNKIGVGVVENTSGTYNGYAWAQLFTN